MEGEGRQGDDKDSLRKGGDKQIGDGGGGSRNAIWGAWKLGKKTESTLSQNQSALYPANINYLAHRIPDQETLLCTP